MSSVQQPQYLSEDGSSVNAYTGGVKRCKDVETIPLIPRFGHASPGDQGAANCAVDGECSKYAVNESGGCQDR